MDVQRMNVDMDFRIIKAKNTNGDKAAPTNQKNGILNGINMQAQGVKAL